MKFSKHVTIILLLLILSCSGDESTSTGDFNENQEFIISVVQGVSGAKLSFAEFKSALNLTNLPVSVINSEEINGFLATGYSTNLQYYINIIEVLHPILNNTTTSFIDSDSNGVQYSYASDLGGGLYLVEYKTLLPIVEAQYEELLKADIVQTYRSAYVEIDIGVVSKLISFLAENPENVVNNTGQLRINYRIHTNRIEVNYIYEVLLGGTVPYKAEGFGQVFNTGSGKMEWTVESDQVTTDYCWSWDTAGVISSCLTN